MTVPLYPEFAPITFSWGFLRATPPQVQETLCSWLDGLGTYCLSSEILKPLREALSVLSPLTRPPSIRLLAKTRSAWTACFENGVSGADLLSFMTVITHKLQCDGLVVRCVNDKRMYATNDEDDHLTHIGFELFKPGAHPAVGPVRAVSVHQYYGKWKFSQRGDPQPGEDLRRYESSPIQNRLTLRQICDFCGTLELAPFETSFYLPEAILVDWYTEGAKRYATSLSLDEAAAVFSRRPAG